MGIFQKSVVQKYIKTLDASVVGQAYEKFKEFYGDMERVENIKLLKEENYQEGFLREIFVQVLGYTINPDSNYNLTTEYKNQTDAKKADGAILKDGKAIGVIELKSTKTKSLESIKEQAFNYKVNQPNCKYVITSNFHKLRFYIDNATEFEEFDLFNITENEFQELYLILAQENLFNEIPIKLKEETKFHEENISDKFYKDYSAFKNKIFRNLIKNNPDHDKLLLFKKTQKFLDRLLFIFFAEDNGLVPPNAISKIIEQWVQLKDLEAYQPLYDRFKLLFDHLNTGHTYKTYELPAYNGGLFAPDEVLDNIKIDDEILKDDSLKLSAYDFNTDVDVNILGHIFEHSLSEIEEITSELQGEKTDSRKTKRKKEGIFYTPKYITKYIVENTVGKLCYEKKEELEIVYSEIDETYHKANGKISQKGKNLYKNLEDYKKWMLTLKILDPACGSGAFLNTALEFLIREHKEIDDIISELLNEPLRLFDTDIAILENNLFGVDINEESVEIAKLSLWLRTARKGRKLSILSNNIKCGNSLIDDPEVAGDKAFDWNKEFSEIMSKGGFDVVIGNPPYVRIQNLNYTEIDFYKQKFTTAHKRIDISLIFFEKGIELLRPNGLLSYITSIQFVNAEYGRKTREFLLGKRILEFIDYNGLPVFEEVTTYPGILIIRNASPENFVYRIINETGPSSLFLPDRENSTFSTSHEIPIDNLTDDVWVFKGQDSQHLLEKITTNCIRLKDFVNPCTGLTSGADSVMIFTEDELQSKGFERELFLPVVRGRNILRSFVKKPFDYILYPYVLSGNETVLIDEETLKSKFPKTYNYLLEKRSILETRKDSRKTLKGNSDWYKLVRKGRLDLFKSKKILTPGISKENRFAIDHNGLTYLCGGAGVFGLLQEKFDMHYLIAILNSKVVEFFMHSISTKKQGGYYSYLNRFLEQIPIPNTINDEIANKSKQYEAILVKFEDVKQRYLEHLEHKYDGSLFSSRIQNWPSLDFKGFLKELKKAKVQLSLSEEAEWMQYFNEQKQKVEELKLEKEQLDKEIDQMVYELYGLTEDEIGIVEKA